jgi:DNA-binding NtrC family response regulator
MESFYRPYFIVADDGGVLDAMQDQLSRDRYQVTAISSVKDALQRLRMGESRVGVGDR